MRRHLICSSCQPSGRRFTVSIVKVLASEGKRACNVEIIRKPLDDYEPHRIFAGTEADSTRHRGLVRYVWLQ